MASPYSSSFDAFGAEEIGALIALLEAMDADLAARRITARNGEVRSLVKLRIGASRRLQEWLGHYALTPRATAAPAHSSSPAARQGNHRPARPLAEGRPSAGDHRQHPVRLPTLPRGHRRSPIATSLGPPELRENRAPLPPLPQCGAFGARFSGVSAPGNRRPPRASSFPPPCPPNLEVWKTDDAPATLNAAGVGAWKESPVGRKPAAPVRRPPPLMLPGNALDG